MPRMNIRPTVRRPLADTTRFERRFINGHWTVFDSRNFGHGPGVGTAKEADRIVRELNEGKMQWVA